MKSEREKEEERMEGGRGIREEGKGGVRKETKREQRVPLWPNGSGIGLPKPEGRKEAVQGEGRGEEREKSGKRGAGEGLLGPGSGTAVQRAWSPASSSVETPQYPLS